ncbi:hypothetical protein HK099_002127, partial [Clydaea vesicula]
LKGYGEKAPHPRWKKGAKIAISFVVNYEEGGENNVLLGDKGSEVFLNETPGGTSRQQRDLNMETQYEYGSRCGFWRLLRMFEKYEFKFTCYAVGKAIELNPEVVDAMESRGHEVASHNYRWIDYSTVDEATERQHVRDTIKAIQNASSRGNYPKGWYTGRLGLNSRKIVWEEYKKAGLELKYECDAYNDDLPYWKDMDGQGLLIIPYTLDQNDMKFCVPPGFTDPDAFYKYLKNTFDVLYEEGATLNQPKLMSVGLHCRLAGKPGRAAALNKFLEHVKSFKDDDVWVCTRSEIADHWREVHPFNKK